MFETKQIERKKEEKIFNRKLLVFIFETFTVDNKVHLVDDKHTQKIESLFFVFEEQKKGDIFVIPCGEQWYTETDFTIYTSHERRRKDRRKEEETNII